MRLFNDYLTGPDHDLSWSRAVMTLCNPGDGILTEEWTYPSACAGARPLGMHVVSVKIDDEGMSSEDLEQILSTWDEEARGMKRFIFFVSFSCSCPDLRCPRF